MKTFIWLCGLVLLVACEQRTPETAVAAHDMVSEAQVLAQGERLYAEHCARCHGARAEGAPNWQKPDKDGKNPPPPLDASGHAWHHPRAALRAVIKGGTANMGGNMPAWNDKLNDEDIEAIIAWMYSRWPVEIRQAWNELDARSGGSHRH